MIPSIGFFGIESNSMPKGWGKKCTSMLNNRKSSKYAVFDLKQNKTSLSQENLFIYWKVCATSWLFFLTPLSIVAKKDQQMYIYTKLNIWKKLFSGELFLPVKKGFSLSNCSYLSKFYLHLFCNNLCDRGY